LSFGGENSIVEDGLLKLMKLDDEFFWVYLMKMMFIKVMKKMRKKTIKFLEPMLKRHV